MTYLSRNSTIIPINEACLSLAKARHLKLERGDSVLLSREAGPMVRHLTVVRQPAAVASSYPVASIAAIACTAKGGVAVKVVIAEQPARSDRSSAPSDDPLSTDTSVDIAFLEGELEGGHTQPGLKRALDSGFPGSSKRGRRENLDDAITGKGIKDSGKEGEWDTSEFCTGAAFSAGIARTADEAGSVGAAYRVEKAETGGAELFAGAQENKFEVGKVRAFCWWYQVDMRAF